MRLDVLWPVTIFGGLAVAPTLPAGNSAETLPTSWLPTGATASCSMQYIAQCCCSSTHGMLCHGHRQCVRVSNTSNDLVPCAFCNSPHRRSTVNNADPCTVAKCLGGNEQTIHQRPQAWGFGPRLALREGSASMYEQGAACQPMPGRGVSPGWLGWWWAKHPRPGRGARRPQERSASMYSGVNFTKKEVPGSSSVSFNRKPGRHLRAVTTATAQQVLGRYSTTTLACSVQRLHV